MVLQVRLLLKASGAKITHKRSFTSMNPHVQFQDVFSIECARAHAALERLFSCVNPNVHGQIAGIRTCVGAQVTPVNFSPFAL